jgi:transcription elongation factor GreA
MEPYVVTPEGLERMKVRLKQIKEFDRPQNVRDIEEARAHGDLRENAEYHAAKERQGFLEGEMRSLEDRIARAQPVDASKLSGEKIMFGATVRLLNLDSDEEVTYKIVGEDEADTKTGSISYKAPIAKALMGKTIGDEVVFQAPGGKFTYEVVAVSFK